jgi:hypothetical protein
MSIGTIEALLDPALLPDLAVICRGCIEFECSLEAVSRDASLAGDYLKYEKHAKAKYLKLLERQADLSAVLKRGGQFAEEFGDSPENYAWDKWCARQGGITGILRKLNRTAELRLYSVLSHFVHGSVVAIHILNECITDPPKYVAAIVDGIYCTYLESSCNFLAFAWGPIATRESERCKEDFAKLRQVYESVA